MNPWRIALFAVLLTGAPYFLIKKRRFDFLTIGFFSAAIYFMPGFFGHAAFPAAYGLLVPWPLSTGTYVVMVSVMLTILLAAMSYDLVPHRSSYAMRLEGAEWGGVVALAIAAGGLLMTLLTVGRDLFSPDKNVVLAGFNRWAIVFEIGASLAAVMLAARRRWVLFSLALLMLLFDVYLGVRVSAALTFIALLVLWIEAKGPRRVLFSSWRLMILSAGFAVFFLVYKVSFVLIKMGAWGELARRLKRPELYVSSVQYSEPFITQIILDQVLVNRFRVGPEHLQSVLMQFVFFAPSMGATAVSFNDLFQRKLFPHAIGWGMANNIWAEMWSTGGVPLLGFFIVFFAGTLIVASRLMRIGSPEIRAFCALLFSYWAFYIHRNDLMVEANYIKRISVIGAASIVGALVLHDITRRVRRRTRSARVVGTR